MSAATALVESSDEGKPGKSDQDILSEARARYQRCIDAETDMRGGALDDLKFLAGDHWPVQTKMQRQVEGRPCLTINPLPTYLHQITNDQRQNKPSIKVHPVDDGADEETAKTFQGVIRHIEYDSNAGEAYNTATNHAAAIGFGYFRWLTEYEDDASFDQVIRFQRFRNPLAVHIDPLSVEIDGSDMMYCFIDERMARSEFERQYPNADAANWPLCQGLGYAPNWWSADSVLVCEYYRIELSEATVCLLSDGTSGYKDDLAELPPGVTIVKERKGQRRKVMWYKLTGADVLDRKEILCKWIPVFPIYGDEIDIEGRVIRFGMIRNAKDPAQMYDYWITTSTEEVALRPKTPFIGAVGQFETARQDWMQANNRSFSFIEYDPVTVDGQIAPPPQRQMPADVPSGSLAMMMHAADNIKKVTGLFDASLGAIGNATSGKQELAQQRQGQVANFHYVDNAMTTIKHCGRTLVYSIPKYYDADRVVRILGEDETISYARINAPNEKGKKDSKGRVLEVLNDLSAGAYDVTISSGPGYQTLRQEAVDGMAENMQKNPELWQVIGDLYVRNQDWPGAHEMAERIARTIPPNIKGPDQQPDDDEEMVMTPKGPLPVSQVGPAIEQMDGVITQLEQKLQELDALKTETEHSKQRTAEIEAETAKIKAEAARIQANADALRAQFETGQIHGQVAGAIQADTLRTLLDTPIEQIAAMIGHAEPDGEEVGGMEPPGPEETQPEQMQ